MFGCNLEGGLLSSVLEVIRKVLDVVIVVEIPDQAVEVEAEPEPSIFSHHTSGSGIVCNTGPLNN